MRERDAASCLAEVYADFADQEAASRSPLYADICRGIADDAALLVRLAELPLEKQQPNLLLAAVNYLFGVARDWPHFRALAEAHWDDAFAVIMTRRTQTNEPARCATLLPLLALLPQPLALLEVGASAGYACCRTNMLMTMAVMSSVRRMAKRVRRSFTARPMTRHRCRRRISKWSGARGWTSIR